MTDASAMPVLLPIGQAKPPTVMERLADIPEEEIWLAKQKTARTRRAYRLDVRHFMATIDITTTDELRHVDHRAVIAWERHMREVERRGYAPIWSAQATPRTWTGRCSARSATTARRRSGGAP